MTDLEYQEFQEALKKSLEWGRELLDMPFRPPNGLGRLGERVKKDDGA